MTTPMRLHRVLSACAMAAFLAGCESHTLIFAPKAAANSARTKSKEFRYKPVQQNFRVPSGVSQLTVVVSGAGGASGPRFRAKGGLGGKVTAMIPVAPGETLAIFVGGKGRKGQSEFAGRGGFNGGGDGGIPAGGSSTGGDGGGGASDIREGGNAVGNRIVIAGGGGGAGGYAIYSNGPGGAGGGETGGKGKRNGGRDDAGGSGGGGGSQLRGGKGGAGGYRSGFGHGDRGRSGELATGGEGGGGGYYGGGGGGSGTLSTSSLGGGDGGGGGSAYVEPAATNVQDVRGAASPGNGSLIIYWS